MAVTDVEQLWFGDCPGLSLKQMFPRSLLMSVCKLWHIKLSAKMNGLLSFI